MRPSVEKLFHYTVMIFFLLTAPCCQSSVQEKNPLASPAGPANSKKSSKEELLLGADIQIKMQEQFIDHVLENGCFDSWALFSRAGFVDKGQTMVLGDVKGTLHIYRGEDSAKFKKQKELSSDQASAQAFRQQTKLAIPLNDYSPKVFDALTYEYVSIVCEEQELKLAKRLKIIKVAKPPTPSEYQSLVKVFEELLQNKI